MSVFGRLLCVLPGLTHLECSPATHPWTARLSLSRLLGAHFVLDLSAYTAPGDIGAMVDYLVAASWAARLQDVQVQVAVDQHAIGTSHIERLLQSG